MVQGPEPRPLPPCHVCPGREPGASSLPAQASGSYLGREDDALMGRYFRWKGYFCQDVAHAKAQGWGAAGAPSKARRLSACTQWLALLSSSGPARRRQPSPTSLPASRPKGQLPTPTRPAPHHPGQPLPQGQTSDNQILVASKHHIRSTKYWCFSPLLSLCQHCAIPSESPPQLTVWTTP